MIGLLVLLSFAMCTCVLLANALVISTVTCTRFAVQFRLWRAIAVLHIKEQRHAMRKLTKRWHHNAKQHKLQERKSTECDYRREGWTVFDLD